jgi:hypothetical protein
VALQRQCATGCLKQREPDGLMRTGGGERKNATQNKNVLDGEAFSVHGQTMIVNGRIGL